MVPLDAPLVLNTLKISTDRYMGYHYWMPDHLSMHRIGSRYFGSVGLASCRSHGQQQSPRAYSDWLSGRCMTTGQNNRNRQAEAADYVQWADSLWSVIGG
jgi:hypothetical protein